jgi:predicted AAA+ superfamily ATPase
LYWDNVFDRTFIGGLTENYVANVLACNGYALYYWESDAQAEVDFIVERDGMNIPIEVKSKDNTRSRSLQSYMKKYNPDYAIRVSGKNFGFENKIKSMPLYAAYLI